MNENNESEAISGELISDSKNALATLEKASIDMQIATAHQFPRSLAAFTKRAIEMATNDDETAESCLYRRPVGKDKNGQQTFAEGLSIRMAEIVGACYGNLRVGARIIEQTDRMVKAQGVAHDLESNFYATSETIEATVDRYGKPYNERMRLVIARAALAKALRDATFKVVPRSLAKPVERSIRNLLYGNAQSISKRREGAAAWIAKLGIDERRVFDALGVKGFEDIGVEQLETLTGLRTSIKDGDVTIDEAFPKVERDKFDDALKGNSHAAIPAPVSSPAAASAGQPALFEGEKQK